ncbi:RDD family protein [Rickettsia asembonensis]|uniref:RDD family protein n=2 Tax=Rickettsia asembonensis TaxID=1068590 RepID=UPI00240F63B4|nr:RDD family protein [Rickettsia asembonensis]
MDYNINTVIIVFLIFYTKGKILQSIFIPAFMSRILGSGNHSFTFFIINIIIFGIIFHFYSIFINAFLLYLTGSTIGKLLLGVKILNNNNKRPNFFKLLWREIIILLKGLGLGIPLIGELANFFSYKYFIFNNTTSWDKKLNLKILYRNQHRFFTNTILSITILFTLIYSYLDD